MSKDNIYCIYVHLQQLTYENDVITEHIILATPEKPIVYPIPIYLITENKNNFADHTCCQEKYGTID